MRIAVLIMIAACLGSPSVDATSPYAGEQSRPIKALSASEIADLEAGKGMGLAKAAELNGYPGPKHVLELADELKLTADQRQQTQTLFDAMATQAKSLGAALIAAERELDRAFAEQTIDATTLNELTTRIGQLQGELRAAHLHTHLAQRDLLNAAQVARYAELRGYGENDSHESHQHH